VSILTSRLTCTRFRVDGPAPRIFGADELAKLDEHAIGKQRIVAGDGSQTGWTAGDHALDTAFELEKNVINDAMHFALRVDENKPPGELIKAYTAIELKALAASNPSGIPSARQKREAKLTAKERLEEEARDGRFLKRKVTPLVWDRPSNELLVGSTSASAIARARVLFQQTFGMWPQPLRAGQQALGVAESRDVTRALDDAAPCGFVAGHDGEIAWEPDDRSRDFLGNEFLLWLWHYLENESDTVTVSDGSTVVAMLSRVLALQCPRGQTGVDGFRSDGPARLPEALRAIQAGKLPRKAGLTLVRHDACYELTLHAESMAVSSAKLPATEESGRVGLEDRVTQIRHLLETLDLLYEAFVVRRLGAGWIADLTDVKHWLSRKERAA
jgi:hypothetical protein